MKQLGIILFLLTGLSTIYAQPSSSDEALAFQYYQNAQYERAAVIYKKLFERKSTTNIYEQYLNSLLRSKAYDEAEKLVRKQIKSAENTYMYAVDLGKIYQEKGQQEKATELYSKLIKELPENEFAIRDLATNLYRVEAFDLSVKTFLTGRKLLKNDETFSFDLLGLYRYRKDKPGLIEEYVNVIRKNPAVIHQAQAVMNNIFDDNADYDLLKTAIFRQLQKDPQNIGLAEMLTWQFIQQKDFDMALRQIIALDKRLKEEGDRIYDFSRLLFNNEAYETTVEALNYLLQKGPENRFYIIAKIDLINAKSHLLTRGKLDKTQLVKLEQEYESLLQEFGKNAGTAFAIRKLAQLKAFQFNKLEEAVALLEGLLEIPGLPQQIVAQTKLELGDIYILTGEVWEANLIFSQVEKQFANEPLGQEAKFRNAKLSYHQGEFTWAKAQLDVLKSSTSQLIANDALNLSLLITDNLQNATDSAALKMYSYADLLLSTNKMDAAIRKLDSIDIKYPGHSLTDDILMTRAKIHVNNHQYNAATEYLQQIINDYAYDLWADDAVFMLADIYETKLQQPEMARTLYQKIITDYPGSLYVIEARKRFRNLRGDKLG